MSARVVVGAATAVLVVVYAVGAGWWVSVEPGWYRSLVRPWWQPPDAVFGIVWPYNFAALVAAGVAVASHAPGGGRAAAVAWAVWLGCLAGSVAAALAWARLFYVSHSLVASGWALVGAAALTVPLLVVAWRARTWAGLALLPYQLWLCVAASLAFGYAARN